MASKQLRNIINSQLDPLIKRSEKEIRNEGKKQLEKQKSKIPTPQNIMDKMMVDINDDTCSPKGIEKYDKEFSLLDNKLKNIEEILGKGLLKMDKLIDKLNPIKEEAGPLGAIKKVKEIIEPFKEPLQYIIALAPLLLMAFTGPAANGPGIDRVQKGERKAKSKLKAYIMILIAIPGIIAMYKQKAISLLDKLNELREKIFSAQEEAIKMRALLRALAQQKETGCLNLGNENEDDENNGDDDNFDPNQDLNEYLDFLQLQYEDLYNQFQAAGHTKALKRIFKLNVEELKEAYTTGYKVINPQN
jgi:hypothetical protein